MSKGRYKTSDIAGQIKFKKWSRKEILDLISLSKQMKKHNFKPNFNELSLEFEHSFESTKIMYYTIVSNERIEKLAKLTTTLNRICKDEIDIIEKKEKINEANKVVDPFSSPLPYEETNLERLNEDGEFRFLLPIEDMNKLLKGEFFEGLEDFSEGKSLKDADKLLEGEYSNQPKL